MIGIKIDAGIVVDAIVLKDITEMPDGYIETNGQSIGDTYDVNFVYFDPEILSLKVDEIKIATLARINIQLAGIKSFDDIEVLKELWLSIAPAARDPTTKWQWVIDVWQAGKDAVITVNALTTTIDVVAYDVETTPSWPV